MILPVGIRRIGRKVNPLILTIELSRERQLEKRFVFGFAFVKGRFALRAADGLVAIVGG
jgi:hypothetical protein